MADVFISYSQKDHEVARGLAEFLNDCGYDVWWDYELVGGAQFRKTIKAELAKARSAIVIWTPNSVESDWVIEEAEEAKQASKLIATRVKDFDFRHIPFGFRGLQTEVVTAPERILRSLETFGVSPSREPKTPKSDSVVIGSRLDPEAIARAEQFAHWDFIKGSADPLVFVNFLQQFPSSSFAQLARIRLRDLADESWQEVSKSEDAPVLQRFAQFFSDDPRAAEVQRRIASLEARAAEEESWERAKHGDLSAVQSHLKIFPDGATAQAARHRIQSLEREREATANWRDIASTSQPEVFEHFLERFPDSPLAAEASARLVELRRMQEMMDWNAARDARHPAALLRFLRLYPNSERTLEAYEKLEALPKTIEREAWSEIENSDQPILYQAYLRALPFSENAKLASAKLKMLTKLTAAPIDATLDRGTKFWTSTRFRAGIGAAGTIMVLATAAALAGGQRPFVAGALLLAAIALDFAAILLFFVGPRLYSDPQGPLRSSIEFYAFGSMAILLWITLTQAISAQTGEGALNMLAFSIVAMVALLAQKYNRLRSVLYVLVPLVGLYYVARAFGAPTYDFITANLYGAGGAALFVLSLVVINARRKAQKAGRES